MIFLFNLLCHFSLSVKRVSGFSGYWSLVTISLVALIFNLEKTLIFNFTCHASCVTALCSLTLIFRPKLNK